ncbi:Pyruvate kinase [Candidatus Ornithobacterium hominis]|nr:pyruvate kinase [Candidatus Ornithobacterium hominis]SZD72793.1 Pyruvate kinase [Candidatus Ornithobacterium hominis]
MKNTNIDKKTKIVATLGPSTSSKEIIRQMMLSGVNVFRINFSHADYQDVEDRIKFIREINEEEDLAVGILADLQGPKLRIGNVAEGSELKPGDILKFTNDKVDGNKEVVYMTYTQFAQDVEVGERILIDDGKLILEVTETDKEKNVKAKVIQGGALKSKKGVNLPNTKISLPALTEKDIEDAKFAISQQVDWIALSFVRHAQDVELLQDLIRKNADHKIPIISKIEKPEALLNIDEIVEKSDGLMVARGDLGVEIPMEEVPLAQKMLVDKAKLARKPIIIATQMMESMIYSLTPTRAEVNDVANSVMDGADAVMLSGETSVGQYPIDVIKTMSNILMTVESDKHITVPPHRPTDTEDERFITNVICYNATEMSRHVKTKAIVTLTYSGYTAFQISSHRPESGIFIFTPNKRILGMLNLLWGVRAFYYEGEKSTDETVVEVNNYLKEKAYVREGDFIINLNAMPVFKKGITNTLRFTTM